MARDKGTEQKSILIVEDDEAIRRLLHRILEDSGFHVVSTRDAEHAVKASARFEGPIHLLITDLVLPGRCGRLLAEDLSDKRPELRILYMSGYALSNIDEFYLPPIHSPYVQKPFTPAQILREVRRVLR